MVNYQREMMKAIGGYFGLEIAQNNNKYIHSEGIHINSGRNALEYILRNIPSIHRLWIPYYTCDVIMEPINKLDISYSFYHINNQLELIEDIHLQTNDYILFTNYYGIKDTYIIELADKYSEHLIVDNAQALYAKPIEGIKTIYSPRKFVGLPDGGIAYIKRGLNIDNLAQDISFDRCSHLLKRLDIGAEAGYSDFRENSHQLVNQPIKRMSNLTWILLQNIDWDKVQEKRMNNFKQLHNRLSHFNRLNIPDSETFSCPMVYPLYCEDTTLKKHLIENKVFVATYWPNVLNWCKEDMFEYELANKVISIPIDQRYDNKDMDQIINLILQK